MKTQNIQTQSGIKPQKPQLEDLIQDTLKDFDKNLIHQFRLEIKKLKAAMLLIHTAHKSFNIKKKLAAIQRLYKDLGAVREIQLQQDKFKENDKSYKASFRKKYKHILEEELLERQDIALNHFDESVIKSLKKLKKQVKKSLKKLSSGDFKKYFIARTSKLKKTLDTVEFSDKKMHAMRKLIKEIKFNARFKQEIAEKWLAKNGINLTILEDLQKNLGDWQDNAILKEKLVQREGALILQNGESEALMQFKSSIEVEDYLIKDKIKKTLKLDY